MNIFFKMGRLAAILDLVQNVSWIILVTPCILFPIHGPAILHLLYK